MSTETVQRATALVVDDERNIRRAIEIALGKEGLNVVSAPDAVAAMQVLNERLIDVAILDIKLGDIDGLTVFRRMQQEGFDVPVIIISGNATLTEAVQAIKMGAFDFLEKPFTADRIAVTVKRCLEYAGLRERLRLLDATLSSSQLVGDSPAMRRILATITKVAATNASVLVSGESGTGKELVASAIHSQSERRERPLVKVNCSAIPDALFESELFGHVAGAFTGARGHKKGLFEAAHRGTLFLDEVADLSPPAQAKMLRVLQSGEIQKIGSELPIQVDVRLVCASNKNLKRLVSDGLFREDLYYRIAVVPIEVPSLRDRSDDIPLLARHLMRLLCQKNNLKEKHLDESVLLELKRYSWPGNVRELQNTLERLLVMGRDAITSFDLPDEIVAELDDADVSAATNSLKEARDNAEREYILAALRSNNGNISKTALALGVGRTYLHKRLTVLRISRTEWFS